MVRVYVENGLVYYIRVKLWSIVKLQNQCGQPCEAVAGFVRYFCN